MDINRVIQIKKVLRGPKPGFEAQKRMLPRPRPGTRLVAEDDDSSLKAGVLVLLYPVEGRLHLALTERTERVINHQGQISLPGGRQEPDESLEETALRETEEELGVGREALEILGELTPLYIPPSRYCIYPTVAYTAERPEFKPSPEEVAELIEIPLDHLMDAGCVKKEEWTIRGERVTVPFYEFKTHKIWGATAMVLAELIAIFECAQ